MHPDETGGDEADPARESEPGTEDGMPSPNEILGTLFAESTLWPLLIVILGSLGSFGAALLVLALADRNVFAMAALALLAGMTVDVVVRSRSRPTLRNAARLLGLLWGVAAGLAGLAHWAGLT